MSLVDSHRPASTGRRIKRMFSTSKPGHNAKYSASQERCKTIPGMGQELSLIDRTQMLGRCLRVFCDKAQKGSHTKSLQVNEFTTVGWCVDELISNIIENGDVGLNVFNLFEVIGRQLPPLTLSDDQDVNKKENEKELYFSEVYSCCLSTNRRIMDVFSVMVPAPGLCRRLELRKQVANLLSPNTSIDLQSDMTNFSRTRTPIRQNWKQIPSFDSHSSRDSGPSQLTAPPTYLLLLKGNRPDSDLIFHKFAPLLNGTKTKLTIGTAEKDDICLYLSPKKKSRSRISSSESRPSPVNIVRGDAHDGTNSEKFYVEVFSGWNAAKPESQIATFLNSERISFSYETPTKRVIFPGDIIRFESEDLSYVFLFKDSTCIPEHELCFEFLNNGFIAASKNSLISNGSRSASRTARISAASEFKPDLLAARGSVSSNFDSRSGTTDELCQSTNNTKYIISLLFPRIKTPKSTDINSVIDISELTNIGSNFPDVSVASASYAHLVRSVSIMTSNRPSVFSGEDDTTSTRWESFLGTIGAALTNELDLLNSFIDKHLAPAIWKTAFCFYMANYFSGNWLKVSTYSGSDIGRGEVDVFDEENESVTPPNADIEDLPYITSLREMAFEEADQAIDTAITHALLKITTDATELCRTFSNSISQRSKTRVRKLQRNFFEKLDLIRECIANILMDFTRQTVKLSQAVDYSNQIDEELISPISSTNKSLASDSDSVDLSINGSDAVNSVEDREKNRILTTGSKISGKPMRRGSDLTLKQTPRSHAQLRIEEVFFRRLLNGLSNNIIELFINDSVKIDWRIGVQLLNFVQAIKMWMKRSGVGNYREPLRMVYEIASLLAISRDVLLKTHWTKLAKMYPEIPLVILWFLLENYEDGEGLRHAATQWCDLQLETRDLNESPEEVIFENTRRWRQNERLDMKSDRADSAFSKSTWRPIDLASLFHMSKTKQKINEFDDALAAKNVKFRWKYLLRRFPPPGLESNEPATVRLRVVNLEAKGSRISDSPDDTQRRSSISSSVRDFGDLLDEVSNLGARERTDNANFHNLNPPLPIQSAQRPTVSVLAFKSRAGERLQNYSRSEINGYTTPRIAKQTYSTKNRYNLYQDKPLVNKLGCSSPNLFSNLGQTRQINNRFQLGDAYHQRLSNRFGSTANLARSMEFGSGNDAADLRSLREDWSQFRATNGASSQVSTIEPQRPRILLEDYIRGSSSCSFYPPESARKHKEATDVDEADKVGKFDATSDTNSVYTYPRPTSIRSLANSNFVDNFGSSLNVGEWNMRYDQSPIGVNSSRLPESEIINVTVERNDKGSFGLTIVEGHTTRLEKPGLYIKATSEEVSTLLVPGDRILAINGNDLTGMTFKDSSEFLKQCKARVTLTIKRGSIRNPEDLNVPRE